MRCFKAVRVKGRRVDNIMGCGVGALQLYSADISLLLSWNRTLLANPIDEIKLLMMMIMLRLTTTTTMMILGLL